MKSIIHRFYFIIVIIFICTSAEGNFPSDQSGQETVPADGLFSHPERAVLSMDIKDEPLKKVLERISDQHGITFVLPPSLAEEKVMIRFSDLPLEEGLSKILSPYNHIFIYREPQRPAKSSVARLEKIRIFPHQYEGRVQEPLMKITEGASESRGAVPSENTGKERAASSDEGSRGETYIETLTTTLQGRDSASKLDAIEVLKNAPSADALRALSIAMRDNDPQVKNEAVSALKELGKELAIDQGEVDDTNNFGTEDDSDDEVEPRQVAPSKLRVGIQSGNSANIALINEGKVAGVQFKVVGAQVTDVQTTARTEGFFTKFDQKSGTVILTGISGQTIAPGIGPIVKIGHSGGRVSISQKTIGPK